jgi:hypothetical protein
VTEAQLQQATIDTATALGWLSYHTYDSRKSAPGFPDCAFVRAPRLLLVEFKGAKEPLRIEQQAWALELELVEQGCVSAMVNDVPLFAYRLWRPEHWLSGEIEEELRGRPW